MVESMDISADFVDPKEDLFDPSTRERWLRIGVGNKEELEGLPETWEELQKVRKICRELAVSNEFAINGHENRISYIVGSGHSYDVNWKPGEEPEEKSEDENQPDEPGMSAIKTVMNEFLAANKWHKRQQEIVRRKDRDGECFIRVFAGQDGSTRIRFVEPAQVQTPTDKATDPSHSFGIQTDPEDVETVLGYWVDGKLIDATEIQHRKANVDSNVKRGLPLFFPVRKNLSRAEKLLRNMSVVAEIQSAIAMIRKHGSATKAGLEQFVIGNANATVTNTSSGTTDYFRRYRAGSIIDSNANTEYEFPSTKTRADAYVGVLQAELRAIASRLVMPEFMLSSDASNANYSSTMVAEGPAVKMFERLQWDMIEDDIELLMMVLRHAESAGRIPQDILDRIEITAQPPTVQTRDRLKDAQADNILVQARAMSAQTMAERNDLDWSVEEKRIADEAAASQERWNPYSDISGSGKMSTTVDKTGSEDGDNPADGEPQDNGQK
jgi:hypothetical protein